MALCSTTYVTLCRAIIAARALAHCASPRLGYHSLRARALASRITRRGRARHRQAHPSSRETSSRETLVALREPSPRASLVARASASCILRRLRASPRRASQIPRHVSPRLTHPARITHRASTRPARSLVVRVTSAPPEVLQTIYSKRLIFQKMAMQSLVRVDADLTVSEKRGTNWRFSWRCNWRQLALRSGS